MPNTASFSSAFNAGVVSVALTDRYLYVAGGFDHVGPPCGNWTSFDLATGAPLSGGLQVAGPVFASVSDGAGGWFLGGLITGADGVERHGLVHQLADGTLSSWAPVVSGPVNALALRGDTLFVGGGFTSMNGIPRSSLAALDARTGALLPWGSGASNAVRTLLLVADTLFVGGSFRSIHGVERSSLAALDASSGAVLPWSLPFTGSPFAIGTPYVSCIVQDGERLLIGGDFNTIAGLATGSFAAIERATATVVPGSFPVGYGIADLLVHGSRIYVSGGFAHSTSAGTANGIVALSRSTLQLLPWAAERPRSRRPGSRMAASGDRILTGEGVSQQNGPLDPLSALDTTSGALRPFADSLRSVSGVLTMQVEGGRLWVGGRLQGVRSVPRRGLAEIDLLDGQVTDRELVQSPNSGPNRVASDGQRVFGYYPGLLVAIDPALGPAPIWSTALPAVENMLVVNGRLFVQGLFPLPGAASRYGVAEVDPTSGAVLPWGPVFDNPGGSVRMGAMASNGTQLFVGGLFTTVDGVPHEGLVAFRLSDLAMEPTVFDPVVDVRAIACADDRIFLVCSRVGWPQPFLFALDRLTGAVLPWSPLSAIGGDQLFSPSSLALDRGELIVASTLSVSRGPNAGRYPIFRAALTASSWSPYPYQPDDNLVPQAVVSRPGRLVIGGSFVGFGPSPASGIAILTWPGLDVPPSRPPLAGGIAVWPDPVRERLTLRLVATHDSPCTVMIMDVTGRVERSFEVPAGRSEAAWDLRRDDGSQVSPGVHFAVVRGAGQVAASARFVVVR